MSTLPQLERTPRFNAGVLTADPDATSDAAQRWRRVFTCLMEDYDQSSGPVLESLLYALEYLLLNGEESDLDALEEWIGINHPLAYQKKLSAGLQDLSWSQDPIPWSRTADRELFDRT